MRDDEQVRVAGNAYDVGVAIAIEITGRDYGGQTGASSELWVKSIPAIVPPLAFTVPITMGVPTSGIVAINSVLGKATGGNYCSEVSHITVGGAGPTVPR